VLLLPAGLPNYFDADEGYVPLNFGNSEGEPSCEIVADAVEFAYEGHSNRFTVDVDPTGLITLTGDAAGGRGRGEHAVACGLVSRVWVWVCAVEVVVLLRWCCAQSHVGSI
jgi:hypothetical protein